MPVPIIPTFEIVIDGVGEVFRTDARLLEEAYRVVSFIAAGLPVIRVGVHVDAEGDAQAFAFADVVECGLVEAVAPTPAESDDRTIHARVLDFLPVDRGLPFGHVDYALGLRGEQRPVGHEERGLALHRTPVGAVIAVGERQGADVRILAGDDAPAIGFRQRVGLAVG